ncbi:hypothetical protein NMY22_g6454 [Coprinellus aureogranulatus]|nr:hypothetical protein NMY22_g6454 [Coprinellus aureogranulatus]
MNDKRPSSACLSPPAYDKASSDPSFEGTPIAGGSTFINFIVSGSQEPTHTPPQDRRSPDPSDGNLPPALSSPDGVEFCNLAKTFDEEYEELQNLASRVRNLTVGLKSTADKLFSFERLWRASGRQDLLDMLSPVFRIGMVLTSYYRMSAHPLQFTVAPLA